MYEDITVGLEYIVNTLEDKKHIGKITAIKDDIIVIDGMIIRKEKVLSIDELIFCMSELDPIKNGIMDILKDASMKVGVMSGQEVRLLTNDITCVDDNLENYSNKYIKLSKKIYSMIGQYLTFAWCYYYSTDEKIENITIPIEVMSSYDVLPVKKYLYRITLASKVRRVFTENGVLIGPGSLKEIRDRPLKDGRKLVDKEYIPTQFTDINDVILSTPKCKFEKGMLRVLTLNIQWLKSVTPDVLGYFLGKLGVNVICLQEVRIINDKPIKINIPGFVARSICMTREKLGNIIYVHPTLKVSGVAGYKTNKSKLTERCVAVVKVDGITISNTHLAGGINDDKNYDKLVIERSLELSQVLRVKPDLIVGDFNSMKIIEEAERVYEKYGPYLEAKKVGKGPRFLKYSTDGHLLLVKKGYIPVDITGITSKYGGQVDWMYYKPEKLEVISSEIIPALHITDHNGILTTFKMK
jgi:endonuclease/exonuclease/phosphatase family metal-dependent hydrolase